MGILGTLLDLDAHIARVAKGGMNGEGMPRGGADLGWLERRWPKLGNLPTTPMSWGTIGFFTCAILDVNANVNKM
jgi:hypothetical protein